MGRTLLRWTPALLLAAVLLGCGGPRDHPSPTPSPAGVESTHAAPLTAHEIRLYLAVKEKALQNLEEALDDVEAHGGDVLARVQELTVAEHEAARSLGVDWQRFTAVREEVGRLFTAQRQRDDEHLLAVELNRARQDLESQLLVARDQAARQFLEAQLKTLRAQIEKLDKVQQKPSAEGDETKLLETVRAEIATIQGRQDKVIRRLQDLLQRAAASPATNTPAHHGGQ